MKHVSITLKTGLAALLLFVAQVIMPAQAAFATAPQQYGQLKQVFCNIEGSSGKWKAQIGGPSTEHEYPLLVNGQNVYVHSENDVTPTMDQQCETLYGTKTIPVPNTPAINDPCGTGNATWIVPADTASVHWSLTNQNHLIATAQTGYIFSTNKSTYDFGVAPETNKTMCIVKIDKPTAHSNDPCGVNNATWTIDSSNKYTVKQNNDRSVTVTANDGYVFDDGSANGVKSYTIAAPQDSGALCQSEPIPTPQPVDPCGLDNAYWVKPHDTQTVDWSINNKDELIATAIGVLFTNGKSSINFGLAKDSGALCRISVPHKPDTNDPCGVNNATWDVPKDTDKYTWYLNSDGHLIATATANYIFSNGQKSYDFGIAEDSNQPCPVVIEQPTCEAGGTMTLSLPKHDRDDYYFEVTIGLVTTTYKENQLPKTLTGIAQGTTVHVKLVRDGFYKHVIFSKDYTFDMLNCIEIPAQPTPADPCGPANASWVKPENSATVHWSINEDNELVATAIGSLFTDGTATHNYGIVHDSNTLCPPTPPEVTVYCGLYNNDTVSLETGENDRYSLSSYWDGDTLVVTAHPDKGYWFNEEVTTEWTFVDTHTSCEMPKLSTTPKMCHADATVTVDYDTERYYYTIQLGDGEEQPLDSGTTTLTELGTYTVRGYERHYSNDEERIAIDEEDGLAFSETFTVTAPSCEPGKGSITPLPTPIELPHTGSDGFSNLVIALVSAAAVYGAVYFAQPKRV